MPSLIVAPQAPGLPTTPYLTVAEFKAAPTDVDLSALVPGGTQQQQDDALTALIAQASSWMDGFVHYTLGATIDTETRPGVRVRADGYVRVPTRAVPILEVVSFSVGIIPSQSMSIVSAADAWIDDNVIHMPVAVSTALPARMAIAGPGDKVFCEWTYVNGYPNTALAATANALDTSIKVASALGIYPGTTLTIYDSGESERVQVAATYTSTTAPGVTTIPLVSGLQFAHKAVGLSVSALPPNVKLAAVRATAATIQLRGSGGLVLDAVAGTPRVATDSPAGQDLTLAKALLTRYVLPTYF